MARSNSRPSSSSKMNIAALSPRSIAATTKFRVSSDLPVPAGPRISVLEPALDAAAQQRVELRRLLGSDRALNSRSVLGRDQPREHAHAAGLDDRSRDSRRGISGRDT